MLLVYDIDGIEILAFTGEAIDVLNNQGPDRSLQLTQEGSSQPG